MNRLYMFTKMYGKENCNFNMVKNVIEGGTQLKEKNKEKRIENKEKGSSLKS